MRGYGRLWRRGSLHGGLVSCNLHHQLESDHTSICTASSVRVIHVLVLFYYMVIFRSASYKY
jgi:hypothetical protein